MSSENKFHDEDERRRAFASYYGLCSWMDHNVGRIVDALEQSGQLDNTTIVYTSDHGDNVGARGLWVSRFRSAVRRAAVRDTCRSTGSPHSNPTPTCLRPSKVTTRFCCSSSQKACLPGSGASSVRWECSAWPGLSPPRLPLTTAYSIYAVEGTSTDCVYLISFAPLRTRDSFQRAKLIL